MSIRYTITIDVCGPHEPEVERVIDRLLDNGAFQDVIKTAIDDQGFDCAVTRASCDSGEVVEDDADYWKAGERVQAGKPNTDDHDTGYVIASELIDGHEIVTVAWDSGVTTKIDVDDTNDLRGY